MLFLYAKDALNGGEIVAQADRVFLVLYRTRHIDHTVYREHGASCGHRRRTPSDRLPAVLLLSSHTFLPDVRTKKEAEELSFFLNVFQTVLCTLNFS